MFPLPVGEHRLHLKIDWYETRDEAFTVRPGETVDYWCWHTQCPSGPAKPFRSLQGNWIVLMRRHGATVAGMTLEELTFRTIYTARNAALQIQAHTLGHVAPLNAAETRLAGEYNLRPGPVARAWEYWNVRLDKAEGAWHPKKSKARTAKNSTRRKPKRRAER